MKACVVFETRYGNTEKIARALSAGLRGAGVESDCLRATDVMPESLKDYDLLCVGAPTEAFSVYRPMKDFLRGLKDAGLSGKSCFAFDTKVDSRISGSGAKSIEKELDALGFRSVAQRESAIVSVLRTGGAITGARLREGEEGRFVEIGARVGSNVASEQAEVPT